MDYKEAGVDKEKGYQEVKKIKDIVKATPSENVLSSIGGFSGLYQLALGDMKEPVLVSGTDGVGTKLKLAFMTGIHNTVGIDLVAMSVNDIICQGAKPLFFLDYIGTSHLDPDRMAQIVEGVAEGCRQGEMALIGGETAEMPGFYSEEEYDLAGFAVGVVDKEKIIDGSKIKEGDTILGLASSGIHSNGYSLVRKLVFDLAKLDVNDHIDEFGKTLGEELLTPTKIYHKASKALNEKIDVHGYVHITGGGIYENIPRIIPEGLCADIDFRSVDRPKVFDFLQEIGDISTKEMYSTFNMGVGLIVIVDKEDTKQAKDILDALGEKYYELGKVSKDDERIKACL